MVRLKRSATPLVWALSTKAKPGELHLVEKLVGKVKRSALIHAQLQATGHSGLHVPKDVGYPLGDQLERGLAVAGLAGMPDDAFGMPVFHGGNDPDPAVFHR